MIINGRAIALELYTDLHEGYVSLGRSARLGIIAVGADSVIASFVRIKSKSAERLGVEMHPVNLAETSTTLEVMDAVRTLARKTDGIIVQLPLPSHIDVDKVLATISRERDVDGINPLITESERLVRAPVAEAIGILLELSGQGIQGKRAVVVGAGRLVGLPVAAMLSELGADVTVVTLESGSLKELKSADIIVLGAGSPGFVTPDMIAEGVVLIDAGTSDLPAQAGSTRKIVGDADPACASKCALFTPVPGGVGPIAVAMIFKNLLELSKLHNQ